MKQTVKKDAVLVSVLALAGAGALCGGTARAAEWQVEVVDPSGSGRFSSLKIDKGGNVHIAYVPEIDGHPLKYAYWDRATKQWSTMTITPVASFCTLTLDSRQRPHISFADHGTGPGAKLRHVYWDGDSWQVAPLTIQRGATVAYYTSIALDAKDNVFLSYYDYADPESNFRLRLRSVFWNDGHWEARTVDPQGGSGKFNSMAVDSTGHPQIAYANVRYESSSLRYARWNGESWKTEVLEGGAGPFPVYSVAMVLDKNDRPHIAYSDIEGSRIKYATKREDRWEFQVVDAVGQVAYPDRNGIVVDPQGNPYISYYDGRLGVLKIATVQNGKWHAEVLDRQFAGFTSSLAIDRDTLWVSYADDDCGCLKVAHRQLDGASASRSALVPAGPQRPSK